VQPRQQRTDNSWLAFGDRVVAKSSTAHTTLQQARFAHEIEVYRAFRRQPPPITVPELIMVGSNRLLVLRLLAGTPLEAAPYPSAAPSDAALNTVFTTIEALNEWRPPAEQFATVLDYPAQFRQYQQLNVFTESDVQTLATVLSHTGDAVEFAHGNPRPDNILLDGAGRDDSDNNNGAALLDWDRAGWYHPGYDLAVLFSLFSDVPYARERIERTVATRAIEAPFTVNLALVLAGELIRHRERSVSTQRYRRLIQFEALWQQTRQQLHRLADSTVNSAPDQPAGQLS
jgi:hypothetical protein